jgi:uncharacterized protein (DUF2147 family)
MFMRIMMFVAGAALSAAPLFAAVPITGKWLTEDGKGIIDIVPCGTAICGKIGKVTVSTNGPPTDRSNPDPALRARPLLGMTIITVKDAGSQWQGSVYSPERGKSYKAYVSRNADGTLKMKGCLAAFLCQTQTWQPLR